MGVATVSYVATQSGCAPDTDASEDPSSTAPYDDEAPSVDVAEQALTSSGTTVSASAAQTLSIKDIKVVLPPVGNLMAPPVGNLMAPPVIKPPVVVVPVLPPVGNLMAPPVLEAGQVATELESK